MKEKTVILAEMTLTNKRQKPAKVNKSKYLVMSPKGGLETKTKAWLTGRVSGK
jgi:hypothetical protein